MRRPVITLLVTKPCKSEISSKALSGMIRHTKYEGTLFFLKIVSFLSLDIGEPLAKEQ